MADGKARFGEISRRDFAALTGAAGLTAGLGLQGSARAQEAAAAGAGKVAPRVTSHPRIHMTAESLAGLKEKAKTTHAAFYAKLIEAADEYIAQQPETFSATSTGSRAQGDILPVLAMSYLIAGDRKYLDATRKNLNALAGFETWGDNLDLVTGHFMAGAAIAYDWLYADLPEAERKAIADKMAQHAEIVWFNASEQRIWWHDFFLHNWAHVITGGLAYAAAALWGENEGAPKWAGHAEEFFTGVQNALPEDGSYQEGQSYMTYAWECIIRYFDLAGQLYGRDYFTGTEWTRNIPYLIMHTCVPDPKPQDNAMVFGDGPRHFEWHGPAHQIYRRASAHRDGALQAFADELVGKGIGVTRPGTWLSMLWYDPTVQAEDWRAKEPTMRFFANNDIAYMRSGWDKDAMHVGFKCSNNAGRKAMKLYSGRDLGSGHADADAASFQIFALGQWLAVDPGYTQYKQSANHNTIMVSGVQQLGGDRTWFDVMECFHMGAVPSIDRAESTFGYDYLRGDASKIYRWQARLVRFVRHMLFVKPGDLLVVDELEGEVERDFEWRLHVDDEIVERGGEFHVRKNDAWMRVAILEPAERATSVQRWTVERPNRGAGMSETTLLTARPAKPAKAAVIATALSPYRADGPQSSVTSWKLDGGKAVLALEREGTTRTFTVDLAEGKVTEG